MYESYDDWKGWTDLFSPSNLEIDLYDKEFSGLIISNKDFLDIGFGSGSLLMWASLKGARVAGTELQKVLIQAAENAGIKTYKDLSEIPSHSYDIVTAFDLFEHIPLSELPQFLAEIFRIVRPNGRVIARFPNCQSPAGLASQFGDHTHVSMLSGPIVKHLMSREGFVNISYKAARTLANKSLFVRFFKKLLSPITFLHEFTYRITWSIRAAPLSSNVIIIASKPNELNDEKKT
jgi:2-polyprenyl-3-methyl-5-hydroxy-6-metoxy-1,4-benzoquinol methylase